MIINENYGEDFLKSEEYDKIFENNKVIERMLAKNEILMKQYLERKGLEAYPVDNYFFHKLNSRPTLANGEKDIRDYIEAIQLPRYYIRDNDYLDEEYHVSEIVKNEVVAKNLLSTLRCNDMLDYFMKRFYIWGDLLGNLCRISMINNVSVIEDLLKYCLLDLYNRHPDVHYGVFDQEIINNRRKQIYIFDVVFEGEDEILKGVKADFKYVIRFLKRKRILASLTDDDWRTLHNMRKLRNNVHINSMDTKLYYQEKHNFEKIEESEVLLKKVADSVLGAISQY